MNYLLGSPKPFIELSFAPNLKLVPKVREFATFFYQEVLADADGLSSLAVATHELLENAVRHSTDGITKLRIEFDPDTQKIAIRTFNRPSPDNLRILKKNIDEARAARDVQSHYQKLLRKSVTLTEGSGLGLIRIIAEGGFAVSAQTDGSCVWVIAERKMERGGAASPA